MYMYIHTAFIRRCHGIMSANRVIDVQRKSSLLSNFFPPYDGCITDVCTPGYIFFNND